LISIPGNVYENAGPPAFSIASFEAFENAISLAVAMGGSANTVPYLMAVAYEAG